MTLGSCPFPTCPGSDPDMAVSALGSPAEGLAIPCIGESD